MFEIIVLISCSKGDCPLLTFELLVLVSMEFNCAKTVIKREAYPIDNCAKTVLKRGLSPFELLLSYCDISKSQQIYLPATFIY